MAETIDEYAERICVGFDTNEVHVFDKGYGSFVMFHLCNSATQEGEFFFARERVHGYHCVE